MPHEIGRCLWTCFSQEDIVEDSHTTFPLLGGYGTSDNKCHWYKMPKSLNLPMKDNEEWISTKINFFPESTNIQAIGN